MCEITKENVKPYLDIVWCRTRTKIYIGMDKNLV